MTFKPNLSVKEALDHLADRLGPIIGTRLGGDLGGRPWTVVLEIVDEKKGFTRANKYLTSDLQAQLRMLTERLGNLGFPFDDKQRSVSTVGGELRIVRNQMAHMHKFSTEEAFRANDFCVRLLEHFEDADGLVEARRIRHAALTALAAEAGISEQAAADTLTVEPEGAAELGDLPIGGNEAEPDGEAEVVTPDPAVLTREPSFIGDQRLPFEPWTVVRVGTVEVLDELPKKAAKERVRAAAIEIATYEGPIHLDRLVQLTAQSFGLQRVRASREKKLTYQIRQSGLLIDADNFAWPPEIDPATWSEFRPNDSTADRLFQDISPVEIANAARLIRARQPGIEAAELDVAVLQTFGRIRRTKQIAAHLAVAMGRVA
ncbi:DUF3320 domain-containing protein [Mycolicibacterium fortuitum]|uniref:DUF3320 domain-containing protein n=1 Tax=Mycolicibacterium fortuitum TaxID=1766 RepID=UPI00241F4D09|nr:DUF3320 domain-containing protein [Mycolicibacterium fortuitum]MDG5771679.1 DUF3320 domain-containing protein [Mycolicibacterium fortuitum]MDG5782579.1 DUF3320 domain-containing protein [Mycolicibacterium fortuitum]